MSNRVAGIVLCSKYVQTREFRKIYKYCILIL